MTIAVTESVKESVRRMAANGMNLNMVAISIGCTTRTILNKKELHDIYIQENTRLCEKVGETAIKRALSGGDERETGSTKLLMYIINTKLHWSRDQFAPEINLTGSYSEQKAEISKLLQDNQIDINQYNKLSDSICKQFQVEEHEQRLTALEKIVEEKQNLGGYKQRDDL